MSNLTTLTTVVLLVWHFPNFSISDNLIRKGFWNTSWMGFLQTTGLSVSLYLYLGSWWRHFTECPFPFDYFVSSSVELSGAQCLVRD